MTDRRDKRYRGQALMLLTACASAIEALGGWIVGVEFEWHDGSVWIWNGERFRRGKKSQDNDRFVRVRAKKER